MSSWFFIICQLAIIFCALVGGVFLTFSDFIMRSLDKADPASGIEVMQIINREVFRYVFIPSFFVLAGFSLFAIPYAAITLSGTTALLVIIAGVIYLAGVFLVTIVFNVPMNNKLATLEHSSPQAEVYWQTTYLPDWTFWNTMRAISCLLAAICFMVATIGHGF